ncbi:hypothetical protein NEOLEDRAFT_1131353 [Neolentinus lepideus HHB14362 ss-1]|uniref:Uncharacterized protein n=1 Tax=Neolentinus lepideus HHB14362 ss-1 TaxID=1314782 RepID=A0A165TMD6_9AGAM|nr:hypothetical protein NEOLEDRAFT_1131353 [Neolentinus lepideus HHB14362 ss-1]
MSIKTRIFLTCTTGYIGGTMLQRLLSQRSDSKMPLLLESLQFKHIIGSHSDLDKLQGLASEADRRQCRACC